MSRKVWISDTQWVYDDAVLYKDPNATLDYAIDLANGGLNDGSDTDTGWLQGDTISTVSWTVPTGITQASASATTKVATIWLSGGTAGTDYLVTARVTTASGRINDFTLQIKVRSS